MVIEKELIRYLESKISYPVFAKKPVNPPSKYVAIQKTGGSRADRINKATMAIQTISEESLLDALDLCEEVKNVLDTMAEDSDIFSAKYQTDYDFTDPTTKVYRYQAVYDFYY